MEGPSLPPGGSEERLWRRQSPRCVRPSFNMIFGATSLLLTTILPQVASLAPSSQPIPTASTLRLMQLGLTGEEINEVSQVLHDNMFIHMI